MKRLIIAIALCMPMIISCTNMNSTDNSRSWEDRFDEILPLLGHRNWVVIADMAYPLQSGDGILTIYADEPYLDVIKKVKGAIDAAPHVRPLIWRDRELDFIDESLVAGVDALKAGIVEAVGPEATAAIHEDIIRRLDEEGKLYQVVIIKTPMRVPYTTVFFQLDCGYWPADKADILAGRIAAASAGQSTGTVRF